jgi:hypothetical protein
MTYAELLSLMQSMLQNTETTFVANIPQLVRVAERRVYNEAQLPVTRQNSTTSFTASSPYLAVPTDFISVYEMTVISSGQYSPVIPVDVGFIRECYPDPTVTGTPKHYALFDQNAFLVGPTPTSGLTAELHYFRMPSSIVTEGSTWLGTNWPDALLYASLLEGYIYMKGEADLLQVYNQHYQESLAELKVAAGGKMRGDTYRDGQAKGPVP